MFDWKHVKKITVLMKTGCTDMVYIETDFPCPFKDESLGNLTYKFETSPNMAENYVNENLLASCPSFLRPEVKIIDTRLN